jgi:hypothetical protein
MKSDFLRRLPNGALLRRVHRTAHGAVELAAEFRRVGEHNVDPGLGGRMVVVEDGGDEGRRPLLRAPDLWRENGKKINK